MAAFLARRDFAVNSRTLVRGLRLEAADDAFAIGGGPEVRGPLLALVMAMAGRRVGREELDGDGREILAHRGRGRVPAAADGPRPPAQSPWGSSGRSRSTISRSASTAATISSTASSRLIRLVSMIRW